MSLPYPVEGSQHLQIPDPDRDPQYYHNPNTPFVNPQQQQPPYPPQQNHYPPQQNPYPPQNQNLPYPPPQGQHLPYPAHQPDGAEQYPSNPGYGNNFQESMSNLDLNEGLHDLGKNLLKQGKNILRVFNIQLFCIIAKKTRSIYIYMYYLLTL